MEVFTTFDTELLDPPHVEFLKHAQDIFVTDHEALSFFFLQNPSVKNMPHFSQYGERSQYYTLRHRLGHIFLNVRNALTPPLMFPLC